jgi:hypothetical protein
VREFIYLNLWHGEASFRLAPPLALVASPDLPRPNSPATAATAKSVIACFYKTC